MLFTSSPEIVFTIVIMYLTLPSHLHIFFQLSIIACTLSQGVSGKRESTGESIKPFGAGQTQTSHPQTPGKRQGSGSV